jgi:8-oxo-dGTP pyrophosphatase MutT (NUDIX family)
MDLGEPLVTAAVREVKEEAGINCQITGPVGDLHRPQTAAGHRRALHRAVRMGCVPHRLLVLQG